MFQKANRKLNSTGISMQQLLSLQPPADGRDHSQTGHKSHNFVMLFTQPRKIKIGKIQ